MRFSKTYPDFASVEAHIHHARVERSVYLAAAITEGIMALSRGFKRVAEKVARNMDREIERRAIESDPFLKRYIPRY